jgi:hypothetical protein
MAEQTSTVDRGTELENIFNQAHDRLDEKLGEKKSFARYFLIVADVVDSTIYRTLDEQVDDEFRRDHHRSIIFRSGLTDFIGRSAVGDTLSRGLDYHLKLAEIVELVEETWRAKNALRAYKRQNK